MTPESQTSTHYLWVIARHNAIDDEALSAQMYEVGAGAFMEDKVALEQIEQLVARDHRPDFREKIYPKSDAGGIQVLRMLARMAQDRRGRDCCRLALPVELICFDQAPLVTPSY